MRKANVVAVGKVKILKLTRKAFLEQLGNLADVVAENFKRKASGAAAPPTLPRRLQPCLTLRRACPRAGARRHDDRGHAHLLQAAC